MISIGELEQRRSKRFGKLDPDGDGFVSVAEVEAAAREGREPEKVAKALDRDKDGKVSQSEYIAGASAVMKYFDKNGDGGLDKNEWRAARR